MEPLPGKYVIVGLEHLTPPPNKEAHMVRFTMTRAHAALLSKALDELARTSHVEPKKRN